AAEGGPLPRETILVVDDNADMRDYVRRLLERRWDVVTARDGDEARQALASRSLDLVITDVMMPDVGGFELLEAIPAAEGRRELPVIMLSARAGEEARVEGVSAGADEYLVKPFSARELVARVDALLLRRQLGAVERAHAAHVARMFEHAPVAIALLRGPEHQFEVANAQYREVIGRDDVVGKPLRDALPEVMSQEIVAILDGVRATGEPYVGRSFPVALMRGGALETVYFDFVY